MLPPRSLQSEFELRFGLLPNLNLTINDGMNGVNKCYNIVYLEAACIIQYQFYGALKAGVHTGRDPFSSSPFLKFPTIDCHRSLSRQPPK